MKPENAPSPEKSEVTARDTFKRATADNPYSRAMLFNTPDEVAERAYVDGFLAAVRAFADPNDTLTRGARDEFAERFVVEHIQSDSSDGYVTNAELVGAFEAWMHETHPENVAFVLARKCTRALHRALNARGLGQKVVGTTGPAREGIALARLSPAIKDAVEQATIGPVTQAVEKLKTAASDFVDSHLFESRDPHAFAAASDIRYVFREKMGPLYPEVAEATAQAISRAIALELRRIGIHDTAARTSKEKGHRGLVLVDEGIEARIARNGRDDVIAKLHIRDH